MNYESRRYLDGKAQPALPWNPFKSVVVPRPIGWITTISAAGVVNLAPYSYFQAVGDQPDTVMFSATPRMYLSNKGAPTVDQTRRKDTEDNIAATGEFVCNLATWDDSRSVVQSSASVPSHVSEAQLLGLDLEPSHVVRPSRLRDCAVALECVHIATQPVPRRGAESHPYHMVFGEVVSIYLRDDVINEGRLDVAKLRPLARLGYDEYTVVERVVRMRKPDLDLMADGVLPGPKPPPDDKRRHDA